MFLLEIIFYLDILSYRLKVDKVKFNFQVFSGI